MIFKMAPYSIRKGNNFVSQNKNDEFLQPFRKNSSAK